MNKEVIHHCAELLRKAEKNHSVIVDPLVMIYPDITIEDAYRIQMVNVKARQHEGARVIGYKIGITSKEAQKVMGVSEPDFGHLFDDMLFEQEQSIPLSPVTRPKIEAEIALIMGKSLSGPGVTMADVLNAAAVIVPAFEIVASRIADWKIAIQDTVADNASGMALVLGASRTSVEAIDLKCVGVTMERNGKVLDTVANAALQGHPAQAVAWLANALGSRGLSLNAGAIILTGALSKTIEVVPGDVFTARFDGLGTVKAIF
ncbi:MAG: fumarylacetoacetate hydrolase family protein [Rhodospirillaceae bacterium]|nr:fumarylacetoacetate hydrolase family protein [Rhodospirillaceae bacterium]